MYYYDKVARKNVEFDILGKIPGSKRIYRAYSISDGKFKEVGIISYYDDEFHKKAVDIYFAKKRDQIRIQEEQKRNSLYY